MVRLNGCSRKKASAALKVAAHADRSAPGCFGWWSRHRVEQVLRMVSTMGRRGGLMKLGLQLGYWGAQPPENHAELVAAAEEAGFDTVFTAEAWGSDAFTPLAWWGRETTTDASGHVGRPAVGAHADRMRDGRADAGPPLRRPAHPRARRLRARRSSRVGTARSSPSRWPAPASTSTSCARSGPGRRPCTATARTIRCR